MLLEIDRQGVMLIEAVVLGDGKVEVVIRHACQPGLPTPLLLQLLVDPGHLGEAAEPAK